MCMCGFVTLVGVILFVDFEKAYDSVCWDFLDDVLCKFGFGDKWRRWIQSCLHSSRGSIIINGSPTEEFQFGKGLKQRDPLSPFLFILIMETLHLSFQRVVDEGLFHGIKLHDMNKVMAPKDKGGLGVSSLYALNRGLLFKWVWRFLTQRVSLWSKVIKAIHGVDGSIGTKRKGDIKSCWTQIVNEVHMLANKGIDLMKYMKINLGNGESMLLWDDPWHAEGILKDRYPRVYALETCKSVTIGGEFSVASVRMLIDDKVCTGGDQITNWIRSGNYKPLVFYMRDGATSQTIN
nr:RNA-directed DNA polymerase, eukaryota, reverse transcriptase zinc-binding domain protein [Tanacetum cinerariifolium]